MKANRKFQDYGIFFQQITGLIRKLQKTQYDQKFQLQNDDIQDFIPLTGDVKKLLAQVEVELKSGNKQNLYLMIRRITWVRFTIGSFLSYLSQAMTIFSVYLLDKITTKLTLINDQDKDNEYNQQTLSIVFSLLVVNFFVQTIVNNKCSWYQNLWQNNCQSICQYLLFKQSFETHIFSQSETQKQKKKQQPNLFKVLFDQNFNYREDAEDQLAQGNSKQNKEKEENKEEEEEKQTQQKQEKESQQKEISTELLDVYNLMTSDASGITGFWYGFNQTFGNIVYMLAILYQLYLQLGTVIINGIYILAILVAINLTIGYVQVQIFKKIMAYQDKRVSLTTDIIEGIQSIKYLNWERLFEKQIQQRRRPEYLQFVAKRSIDGVQNILWGTISYVLLYIFLTQLSEQELKSANVFTIIALFGLLIDPIGVIPYSIASLLQAQVNYKRMRDYLLIRQIDHSARLVSQNFVLSSLSISNSNDSQILDSIEISNMQFTWPQLRMDEEQQETNISSVNQVADVDNGSKASNSNENSLHESLLSRKSEEKKDKTNFQIKIHDLQIGYGTLNFVIGQIGSGKSAFLKAILNEMGNVNEMSSNPDFEQSSILLKSQLQSQNQFIIRGSVGYVAQNHWLQNRTVKENILFGKEFNKTLYDRCLTLTQLDYDLQRLPNSEDTLISSNGANLSGGQKQRISLARAIYQDSDIYLFDDIFSSLDVHVADSIFQNAIVQYLNEEKKKTIIFVTSHHKYLKEAPKSRLIIIEKGCIIQDEAVKAKYMEEFDEDQDKMQTQIKGSLDSQADIESFHGAQKLKSSLKDSKISQQSDSPQKVEETKNQEAIQKEGALPNPSQNKKEEGREKGIIQWLTIMTYLQAMSLIVCFIYLFLTLLMRASRTFIDFWLQNYIEEDHIEVFDWVDDHFNNDFKASFRFFLLFNLFITSLRAMFYVGSASLASNRIFRRLTKSILFSKMKFFDDNPPGRIISRISKDTETVDDYLPRVFHTLIWDMADCIVLPTAIIIQLPAMSVALLIASFVIYWVQNYFRPANREIKRLKEVNDANILTHMNETCSGCVVIRAFQKSPLTIKQYVDLTAKAMNSTIASQVASCWSQSILRLIVNLIMFSLFLITMTIIWSDWAVQPSVVAMTITYSLILTDNFNYLVKEITDIQQRFISVQRIRQYLDLPRESSIRSERKKQGKTDIKHYVSNSVSIEFKNVSISYDEKAEQLKKRESSSSSEDEGNKDQKIEEENSDLFYKSESIMKEEDIYQKNLALKSISLQIMNGEQVAICGRTGSGKTSILNVLFKLYPIEKGGSVLINGVEFNQLSLEELRENISIIPQFGFIYEETLLKNLDPSEKIPFDHIEQIYRQTGLYIRNNKIDEDDSGKKIEQEEEQSQQDINNELKFKIDQSGKNLSNGEKQIINFLRVIIQNTNIICIDEATSNMDPQTDALLHQKLFQYCQGQTLIAITHRLENIEKFDRVIVLENGLIVENGKVQDLRDIKGGYFNHLIETEIKDQKIQQ